MFSFQCDCCDKMKSADDRNNDGWFVIATAYKGTGIEKEFQIWEFPKGCRLSEAHDALYHVCSGAHLLELMKRLLEKKYQQNRKRGTQ